MISNNHSLVQSFCVSACFSFELCSCDRFQVATGHRYMAFDRTSLGAILAAAGHAAQGGHEGDGANVTWKLRQQPLGRASMGMGVWSWMWSRFRLKEDKKNLGYLMGMSGVCIETWNAEVLKMTVAWSLFRYQKSFLASGKVAVKIRRGQAIALDRSKYCFVLHLAPSKMLLSVLCSTLHRKGRTVNQHSTIVYTLNSESKIIEYWYTYVEHYRHRSIWKNHQHWQPKLALASDCN